MIQLLLIEQMTPLYVRHIRHKLTVLIDPLRDPFRTAVI